MVEGGGKCSTVIHVRHCMKRVCVPVIVFLFLRKRCGSFPIMSQAFANRAHRCRVRAPYVFPPNDLGASPRFLLLPFPFLAASSCSRVSVVCVLIYSWSSMCRAAVPQLHQILGLAPKPQDWMWTGRCRHPSLCVKALIPRSAEVAL